MSIFVEQHDRTNRFPSVLSTAILATFYTSWIVFPLVPVGCLLSPLLFGTYVPTLIIGTYWLGRGMSRPTPKPWLAKLFSRVVRGSYFRSGNVIIHGPPIRPSSNEMLCFHPHGIFCCGWTTAQLTELLTFPNSGIHWLVADQLFRIPILNEIFSYFGCESVSASNMKRLMRRRENIALLPGGFQSAALLENGKHRCFVRQRKGFIKYALQHGSSVRPCYSFGEEETYYTLNWFERFRLRLANYNIPAMMFVSPLLYLPNPNTRLVTVCGEPIQFPMIESPTTETVDLWHQTYMTALQSLFDSYKSKFVSSDAKVVLELL